MEWQVTGEKEIRSVVIPDGLVSAILELMKPTSIPLDPYRDEVFEPENLTIIVQLIKKALREEKAKEEGVVREKLRVRQTPPWARSMIERQIEQNSLITVYYELLDLCEHALKHNAFIKVLGQ